jgi:hypothetical protein
MKKPLLIAVVAGGLMIAGTTRSDAQVYFSIGFGPGYPRILPLRLLLSLSVLLQTLLWRSRRFGHRPFAWLINLEFFSQLLNEGRYFLLPLRFDLLPQRLFDFSAFLNVPGFKPSALLWIELKAGVANCRVSFARNNLPAHSLPLTHEVALLRAHLHPNLGVALEILPSIWRHSEPALLYTLSRRCPVRLT